MHLNGLGSSTWPSQTPDKAACGTNPCTWYDNIYARDACVAYMQCSIPTDPTTTYMVEGASAGVTAAVGQDVGAVANVVGDVVGNAAAGLGTGLASGLQLPGMLAIGAAALIALLLLNKR